jgi:hypothetical protein
MTQIIGGHNLGLQFGSYTILNATTTTGEGTLGHGAQSLVNIANGNLFFQDRDAFLPSFGDDFDLIRTYNSRAPAPAGRSRPMSRWSSTGQPAQAAARPTTRSPTATGRRST